MSQVSKINPNPIVHRYVLAEWISTIIDFFYPPFRKYIPHQTFRYMACGGGNTVLNLAIYYCCIHYVFKDSNWHVGFVTFKPHIAAFIVAFCVTFPIGFLLSKYLIFDNSAMRGKTQAKRYFTVVAICVCLNYAILKLFVEVFHWYPTVSMILNVVIVTLFSYFSQKKFAFKSVG